MSGPVPRESASRCALQAQLRGDPMAGTAPPASRLLLVEQAGPWGPRGLTESRADADLARQVDELAAAGGARMQAIREPARHAGRAKGHRVALADTRDGQQVTWWWRVDDLAELLEQLARRSPDAPADLVAPDDAVEDRDPVYLVCTHGKHDACCALRGRPVATALAEVRPGRVWETTHVGGDRFAANLLVLPYGEMYGRVLPFAASDFVDRIEAGDVVPGLMRGRAGLPPVAQAALVFAHERLAETRRDAFAVTGIEKLEDGTTTVGLQSAHGPVTAVMATEISEPNKLTCRGPQGVRARVYRGVTLR
ncbi:hypothetical protein GCM10011519_30740 [Marmoricola endophyticus]|uniref:Sucrase ferredoxin n=1 Tax=Marmoricola endophyticus TaxID=2040280 RepID=A0A917BQ81_9ACTN|nr:sucrase ferredoxin [Marmoricola endophyticus]GGF54678.1 hypothetical protein GCM10011519_30740 [Marmoricola endophyticus]